MKTLLITRHADGIGDWIMSMSVIKLVKKQYPNMDIFIKLNFSNSIYKHFIREIIENSDVCTTIVEETKQNYDFICNHLIYPDLLYLKKRNSQHHLIKYMVDDLNVKTKLNVVYEQTLSKITSIKNINLNKSYIIMPSCGRVEKQGDKYFGYENYNKLSYYFFKKGIDVVQIGAKNQPKLEYTTDIFLDLSISEVLGILKNCLFYIGEVNGLLHLAGHNNIKSYGLYLGNEHPFFTSYEDQIPIFCNDKSVEQIFNEINNKV